MSRLIEELDYQITPIGALSLRRRYDFGLKMDVFEIKLGDDFLMSSAFTASEVALARLALALLPDGDLDIVVGGLGLGYTAHTVLEHKSVRSLIVVDMLSAVIDWHRSGLLPLGRALPEDPRCTLIEGDFFAMAAAQGFDPAAPGRTFDAILADIDHSPEALLDERSAAFYRPEGLRRLSAHLKPGGVFGLWSNDAPDPDFTERLAAVFGAAQAEPVRFDNPADGRAFTQTVYLARTAGGA
ncbi:MAG: spermidine synthase [Hyphomonas sp.]